MASASTMPGTRRIQPSQHQTVESAENKSLRGAALQHIDLLPQNQDLGLKPYSRAEQADERGPQQDEEFDHRT